VRLAVLAAGVLCAALLGACGDTLQAKPIPHNILESMVVSPFPVYWAGATFQKLAITDAAHDPGGAYTVQYGNCVQGGQGVCVSPLKIVTSPDNSFLPGGPEAGRSTRVRGAPALIARSGRTIVIATGNVVVDIYATSARLAAEAANEIVPINSPGASQGPLPARLPDSGFAAKPLPSQTPPRLGAAR
jgi:hypothetical protein